jgi:predicted nucleic acid-binding protein
VLARRWAYSHTALVDKSPCLQARAFLFASRYTYADIRRAMRAPHGPGLIGDVDTLIAATALERNLTVVTLDQDFTRVPGLRVQLLETPRSTR